MGDACAAGDGGVILLPENSRESRLPPLRADIALLNESTCRSSHRWTHELLCVNNVPVIQHHRNNVLSSCTALVPTWKKPDTLSNPSSRGVHGVAGGPPCTDPEVCMQSVGLLLVAVQFARPAQASVDRHYNHLSRGCCQIRRLLQS